MSDSDSDSGHEETWLDDVAHVDWFLMKSGKSRGKGEGVLITHEKHFKFHVANRNNACVQKCVIELIKYSEISL